MTFSDNIFTVFYSSIYFGLLLYWLPLLLCVAGYTHRTFINYQKDIKKRAEVENILEENKEIHAYYSPTDTVGTIIGRILVCIVPCVNLWAAVFDIGPKFFSDFFCWIGKVFDIPLVPEIKKNSK